MEKLLKYCSKCKGYFEDSHFHVSTKGKITDYCGDSHFSIRKTNPLNPQGLFEANGKIKYSVIKKLIRDFKMANKKKNLEKEGVKGNYTSNSPEYKRNDMLKRHYGITLQDYNDLFNAQKGCCAICGRHQSLIKKTFCVDHDHLTNEIRGLLCHSCNRGLGLLGDTLESLLKAVKYLTTE